MHGPIRIPYVYVHLYVHIHYTHINFRGACPQPSSTVYCIMGPVCPGDDGRLLLPRRCQMGNPKLKRDWKKGGKIIDKLHTCNENLHESIIMNRTGRRQFKTTPSFLGKGGTYSSIHYQLEWPYEHISKQKKSWNCISISLFLEVLLFLCTRDIWNIAAEL